MKETVNAPHSPNAKDEVHGYTDSTISQDWPIRANCLQGYFACKLFTRLASYFPMPQQQHTEHLQDAYWAAQYQRTVYCSTRMQMHTMLLGPRQCLRPWHNCPSVMCQVWCMLGFHTSRSAFASVQQGGSFCECSNNAEELACAELWLRARRVGEVSLEEWGSASLLFGTLFWARGPFPLSPATGGTTRA